ncbi:MAG: hypothetical protein QG578_1156, partial [Thermodesulfobacteriota bacterium]|nr:hypothetical protein [Thermodesulfobacteriota bacterium]
WLCMKCSGSEIVEKGVGDSVGQGFRLKDQPQRHKDKKKLYLETSCLGGDKKSAIKYPKFEVRCSILEVPSTNRNMVKERKNINGRSKNYC